MGAANGASFSWKLLKYNELPIQILFSLPSFPFLPSIRLPLVISFRWYETVAFVLVILGGRGE